MRPRDGAPGIRGRPFPAPLPAPKSTLPSGRRAWGRRRGTGLRGPCRPPPVPVRAAAVGESGGGRPGRHVPGRASRSARRIFASAVRFPRRRRAIAYVDRAARPGSRRRRGPKTTCAEEALPASGTCPLPDGHSIEHMAGIRSSVAGAPRMGAGRRMGVGRHTALPDRRSDRHPGRLTADRGLPPAAGIERRIGTDHIDRFRLDTTQHREVVSREEGSRPGARIPSPSPRPIRVSRTEAVRRRRGERVRRRRTGALPAPAIDEASGPCAPGALLGGGLDGAAGALAAARRSYRLGFPYRLAFVWLGRTRRVPPPPPITVRTRPHDAPRAPRTARPDADGDGRASPP